jgi:uncharacterized protein
VQRTVRLIRSKGVGVFFITQLPQDLPDEVLAQLGNRVQHALRAITPKDAAAVARTVQTYPMTEVYDLASALTSLGVGEAVVTVLSPDGVPTPVAWTRLYPPQSRMAPADPATIQAAVAGSAIHTRYRDPVDPDSACERLTARMQQAQAQAPAPPPEQEPAREPASYRSTACRGPRPPRRLGGGGPPGAGHGRSPPSARCWRPPVSPSALPSRSNSSWRSSTSGPVPDPPPRLRAPDPRPAALYSRLE